GGGLNLSRGRHLRAPHWIITEPPKVRCDSMAPNPMEWTVLVLTCQHKDSVAAFQK
ncbi:hypothetical protein NDU88_002054, partial [Pleurodeles waltl]